VLHAQDLGRNLSDKQAMISGFILALASSCPPCDLPHFW
jgi:hypothetical protein